MKWKVIKNEFSSLEFYSQEMVLCIEICLFYDGRQVAEFSNEKIATVVCRILNALKYNPFKKREISSHEK